MLLLQPIDTPSDREEWPTVEIGESLQFYLGQLVDFPQLSALANLAPGTTQQLPVDSTNQLLAELETFERAVFDRSLPRVSWEFFSPDSDSRIDWQDFAIFCDDLRNVLGTASVTRTGIQVRSESTDV